MCGPTQTQENLQAEQADFYKSAIAESAAVFGQQQELQQQIEGVFMPILKMGPSHMGFNQQELDVLNASAVEGTAENYQQASKALTAKLAAQGGGNVPGLTGAQEQLEEELAQGSAQEEARQQTQILESGYQQGYQEFSDASRAIAGVSDQLSPTSYMGQATGAGSAAATTANQIAQEQGSWLNAALGAAGEIGGQAIKTWG